MLAAGHITAMIGLPGRSAAIATTHSVVTKASMRDEDGSNFAGGHLHHDLRKERRTTADRTIKQCLPRSRLAASDCFDLRLSLSPGIVYAPPSYLSGSQTFLPMSRCSMSSLNIAQGTAAYPPKIMCQKIPFPKSRGRPADPMTLRRIIATCEDSARGRSSRYGLHS